MKENTTIVLTSGKEDEYFRVRVYLVPERDKENEN